MESLLPSLRYQSLLSVDNELALFKGMAICLQFLKSKKLALAKVNSLVFCQGSGGQACKLSPHCRTVEDKDGSLLRRNMQSIELLGYFKNPRILIALREVKGVENILRHPAMWSPLEDTFLFLHCMVLAKETEVNLDHVIKTHGRNGKKNWVINSLIAADIQGFHYDFTSGWHLVRYVRNKITHFNECSETLKNMFGKSPEGVIKYFNEHVLCGGDLTLDLWHEINSKVKSLSHFWVE